VTRWSDDDGIENKSSYVECADGGRAGAACALRLKQYMFGSVVGLFSSGRDGLTHLRHFKHEVDHSIGCGPHGNQQGEPRKDDHVK